MDKDKRFFEMVEKERNLKKKAKVTVVGSSIAYFLFLIVYSKNGYLGVLGWLLSSLIVYFIGCSLRKEWEAVREEMKALGEKYAPVEDEEE